MAHAPCPVWLGAIVVTTAQYGANCPDCASCKADAEQVLEPLRALATPSQLSFVSWLYALLSHHTALHVGSTRRQFGRALDVLCCQRSPARPAPRRATPMSVVAACEGEASCAMVVCYQPHQAPSHIRAVEPLNIRFFS